MTRLEEFLEKEWKNDNELSKFYDDFDDYKCFMEETINQYIDLKKEVDSYKGTLDEYKETLEFGFNNYKENQYLDFNYGNLTVTINVEDNKLILSEFVEIWNDRHCALEYNAFNINEYIKEILETEIGLEENENE